MLVHYKIPKGVLCLNGLKIYGLATNMDPVDIPFKTYEALKESLLDATYRTDYLNSLFPGPFPEVAFRYCELKHLPEKTINSILKGMGIRGISKWSHKKKIDTIKIQLRNASPA